MFSTLSFEWNGPKWGRALLRTDRQRGSEDGERQGGGVRAESAGSSANRRGSSVNEVNEEWERSKCAEMREVPPHCIGCCSLCVFSTHSHIHTNTTLHIHRLFIVFTLPPAVPLCSPPFQHLLTYLFLHPPTPITIICSFRTHPLTLTPSQTYTCILSSPVLFPYVPFFCLMRHSSPPVDPPQLSGGEINCDNAVFTCEVRRYSAMLCRTFTQLIRLMVWHVPTETHAATAHLLQAQ